MRIWLVISTRPLRVLKNGPAGGVGPMPKLKPLSDRLIVKAITAEEKTPGGIVLPDTAKEKPQEGEVLAVGPGKQLDNGKVSPMDIKIGDRVIYSKYGGTEIKLNGDEVVVLRQDDVLGVVER